MNPVYYYSATIIMYVLVVLGSIFIDNVSLIFEFVGLICINCLSFIFPAMFYIYANKQYYKNLKITDAFIEPNMTLIGTAWLQLLIGVVAFVLGMINNIKGIIDDHNK